MTARLRFGVVVVSFLSGAQLASAQEPRQPPVARIGVVLDGPSAFSDTLLAQFRREITDFFGSDRVAEFPAPAIMFGDWTAPGIEAVIDRLLADPGVDLVLALGPISSNELAQRRTLPKPAIAAIIIDAALQDLPVTAGASGVPNLTYVNVAYSASRTLELFRDVVSFRKLAVLIHPGLVAATPRLLERSAAQAEALGIAITVVPVAGSAADALRAIPADADAAYLSLLEQLSSQAVDSVIEGLTARRLPTFSYTGRTEVERGVLASYGPRDDLTRRARRVAGDIQRILDGEDAGTLPVDVPFISQLTVNMATARAIGFSPSWSTLTEAVLLHPEAPATGVTWSLASVVQEAVDVNLDVRAAERSVASGRQEVGIARAGLLPQVQATSTGTTIRDETAAAAFGQQAEHQFELGLSFSQALIDDQTWARYAIEGHLQTSREADRRRAELDVALEAATAFLGVLRAQAIARVERANLAVTRSNLEIAELRERTGASSRADVYRWESELARSRSSVIAADARVQVTALEVNRVLNRPLEEPFQTEDATLADPALLTSEPGLFEYFRNPETFRVFREFMVTEGRAASPELRAFDAVIAAQRRTASAATRSLWLPTFSLQGGLTNVVSRSGAGSEAGAIGPLTLPQAPDLSWSVRLQAAFPIFTGFGRTATRAQAVIEVDRLTLEREAVDQAVAEQIRAALHTAGASYASIEQAQAAAVAARRNLDLVTDAYARGAVAIVTLLDAQQAAVSSAGAAVTAVYDFLLDLMRVERAVGTFTFFRTVEERRAFRARLDEFYRAAGVEPRRP